MSGYERVLAQTFRILLEREANTSIPAVFDSSAVEHKFTEIRR